MRISPFSCVVRPLPQKRGGCLRHPENCFNCLDHFGFKLTLPSQDETQFQSTPLFLSRPGYIFLFPRCLLKGLIKTGDILRAILGSRLGQLKLETFF